MIIILEPNTMVLCQNLKHPQGSFSESHRFQPEVCCPLEIIRGSSNFPVYFVNSFYGNPYNRIRVEPSILYSKRRQIILGRNTKWNRTKKKIQFFCSQYTIQSNTWNHRKLEAPVGLGTKFGGSVMTKHGDYIIYLY